MNSIEIFLKYYPEYRELLDPNHRFDNLNEHESVHIIYLEQMLKEAR